MGAVNWREVEETFERLTDLPAAERAAAFESLAAEQTVENKAVVRILNRRLNFMSTSVPGAEDPLQHEPLAVGARIGVWRIEAFLGAGGMGEVYRAARADGLYDQTVALKLMRAGDETRLVRFHEERRRLAQLDHPGISRIIDGGVSNDDRPYIAMEFVEGATITEHADKHGLSKDQKIELIVALLDAVAHAHGAMILHRDIKPENVLVDRDGHVRLIDFGISASLAESDADAAGPATIAYAAPEQLTLQPLAASTDIFAVGVLAHLLIAGERPRRLPDGGVAIAADTLASADLAAILEKATALRPADRYGAAEALREDLLAYSEHRPVAAREGGVAYRLSRTLRRHWLSSGLAAAVVVSLVAGLGASLNFAARAQAETIRTAEALAETKFHLDRASRWLNTQAAYSDILQALFGGDADLERQNDVLLDHWNTAHEYDGKTAEDAEHASLLAYVTGRHFTFRNDYVNARRVLEAWVEKGYGNPDVLMSGRHLLGIVYMNMGEQDLAEEHLRDVEAWYASGYDAFSADHVAATTQLAGLSSSIEDADKATTVLREALKSQEDALTIAYFYNQLSQMEAVKGDVEAAYQAMKRSLAELEAVPLTDVAGRTTVRLNLAQYEILHRGDHAVANDLIDRVQTIEAARRGENREAGRVLLLKGMIAQREGDLDQAADLFKTAADLIARYAGAGAAGYIEATASLAEATAADGRPAEARALLERLRTEIETGGGDASANQRVLLASQAINGDRADLPPTIDWGVVRKDVRLRERYARLVGAGLAPPQPGL
ncbi:MAG: serine/threonine-protein kinase [Pseudomonadota bacterium]